MGNIYVGVDFHKNTSVLCITDKEGSLVKGFPHIKSLRTKGLVEFFSDKEPCEIGIEATGGVTPYADKLKLQGHRVRIINPNKFRGIGISGKKTDERDAKALNNYIRVNRDGDCEVHLKSKQSRDLKALLVAREMMVSSRTRLTNHVRGVLREYEVTINQGVQKYWDEAPRAIEQLEPPLVKESLRSLHKQAEEFKKEERLIEERIKLLSSKFENFELLKTLPGIGMLTAAALLASVDDISRFSKSSEFASYFGLVPSVSSSASTTHMGSLTKAGSSMVRRYLIHGARAWLTKGEAHKHDPVCQWARDVEQRRGRNKATVALARKMACISYAMLRDKERYRVYEFEKSSKTEAA